MGFTLQSLNSAFLNNLIMLVAQTLVALVKYIGWMNGFGLFSNKKLCVHLSIPDCCKIYLDVSDSSNHLHIFMDTL